MNLAILDEFAAHLGTPVEDLDVRRVDRLMVEAMALIRAVKPSLGIDPTTWPENAFVVLMRVMVRGATPSSLPSGVDRVSEGAGDFSYSYSFNENAQGGGLWLSKQDRLILGVRAGGAYSVDLGANVPKRRGLGDYQW